jgi:hypothetical protein
VAIISIVLRFIFEFKYLKYLISQIYQNNFFSSVSYLNAQNYENTSNATACIITKEEEAELLQLPADLRGIISQTAKFQCKTIR